MEGVRSLEDQKKEEQRIRKLIITCGSDSRKVKGDVHGLCCLEDDYEDFSDVMVETTLECAKHLPQKTSVYGCWLALMRDNAQPFVDRVVEEAWKELGESLTKGQYGTACLLLRMFLELANTRTVAAEPVFALLERLVATTGDAADAAIYCALRALPFAGRVQKEKRAQFDALLVAAEKAVATRARPWLAALSLMPGAEDRLATLLPALKSMLDAQWQCKVMPRTSDLFGEDFAKAEPASLPELAPELTVASQPPVLLQLPVDASLAMPMHERWMLEDAVQSIIENYATNIQACATHCLTVPYLHPMYDRVLSETLIFQALRLPSSPQLPIFYARLLNVIATLQASLREPHMAVMAYLVNHVEQLDSEAVDTLSELFTLTLSLHNLEFPWEKVTGGVSAEKRRFLERTLERLQRLSFHDNLKQRLPAALQGMIPPEPLPVEPEQTAEFEALCPLVRLKDPDPDSVTDSLMKVSDPAQQGELFANALLRLGAKTPTHWDRVLSGHERVFETIRPTDADALRQQQLAVVRAVCSFWARGTYRLEATVDSLLVRGCVQPGAVLDFVLSQQLEVADRPWNYAIVHSVLRKVLERTERARGDLVSAERIGREEAVQAIQPIIKQTEADTEAAFLRILQGLPGLYSGCSDELLKKYCCGWFLAIGRKYHHFVAPFVDKIEALELPEAFQAHQRALRHIR